MPTAVPGPELVLGGARSGKSRYAEARFDDGPALYLATARMGDDEMRERVALHRARRDARWTTIEAPLDLPGAIDAAGPAPLLVDCLTLWQSNLLLDGMDLGAAADRLLAVLARRSARTVLVANEVGLGIVPDNALARRFRAAAGVLHQRIALIAERVVLVVAGIPMVVKG